MIEREFRKTSRRLFSTVGGLCFLALVFIALPADAGIYKWTDAQGNVHYGDKPVAQTKATELNIDIDATAGITNSSGNDKERARMTQELQDDRQAREKSREEHRIEQRKRQKRCVEFKKRLKLHQRANSVYKQKANGERTYLTQEERDAKVKKINRGIAKNCH